MITDPDKRADAVREVHDELERLHDAKQLTAAEHERLANRLFEVASGDGYSSSILTLFEPNA